MGRKKRKASKPWCWCVVARDSLFPISLYSIIPSFQVLQPGVRGREDPHPAPEGQALQVPHLQQAALHRPRARHPLHAGAQGDHRQDPWRAAGT